METNLNNTNEPQHDAKLPVSGSVEYIQLLSTGTKAYWDERCQHYVSENGRFHVSLEVALKRSDMYIHYR